MHGVRGDVSEMPPVITVPTPPPPSVDSTPLGAATTPAEAINVLLDQLLASPHKSKMDTALVRALGEPLEALRTAGLKAGMRMVQVAGEAKADILLAIFDGILDNPPADAQRAERVTGGILEIAGELGFALTEGDLGGLLSRQLPLLGHESPGIATGAARGMASALRGALRAGNATLGGEVASLLTTHLDKVKTAKTPQECREGAYGVGACIGAAGAPSLERLGVLATLVELLGASPSKTAPYAKEAATLAIEQLSCQLGPAFEPYGVPLLRPLVALYADKDKRVADAAALGVRAMLSQLSENVIGKVLPALYDGMAAVQWRTKVECLGALATLAEHAPSAVGPRLPQAIPEVSRRPPNPQRASHRTRALSALSHHWPSPAPPQARHAASCGPRPRMPPLRYLSLSLFSVCLPVCFYVCLPTCLSRTPTPPTAPLPNRSWSASPIQMRR